MWPVIYYMEFSVKYPRIDSQIAFKAANDLIILQTFNLVEPKVVSFVQ